MRYKEENKKKRMELKSFGKAQNNYQFKKEYSENIDKKKVINRKKEKELKYKLLGGIN